MKFFSDEIINQSIFEETERTEERWNQALIKYRSSLELLKGKVTKVLWELAYHDGLHDAKFAGINIQHGKTKKTPTHIEIIFNKKKAFQIHYGKVSRFELTFNEAETGIYYLGIDDCIYSELLEVNDTVLSHDLLFSSGARFYIEFEKISLRNTPK